MVAISDSVTRRPPPSGISSFSRSASVLAPPSVRIAWSRLAEIGAAAGHVDIGRAQRAVDVAGGGAERIQPVGVELDLDLARHAAVAVDAGDALQALQLADDRVVDEPGQLLDGHGRRRDRIGQDRLALDVDAVDDRRLRGGRQVGADALDRVLDVVDGGLRVDLEPELDDGLRRALGDRRGDVLDAGDVGDRVLDALGDLRLKLARRDAGIGHRRPRRSARRCWGSGSPAASKSSSGRAPAAR